MKNLGSKSILKSATRLAEAEAELQKTKDKVWLAFIHRESKILLYRSLKLWWKIRFWRR